MSGFKTYRLLAGQVFYGEVKVVQDGSEGAFGNITFAPRNGGKASVGGVPPDFMGAGALSDKLAAQPAEFPAQHTVGHAGIRSSA